MREKRQTEIWLKVLLKKRYFVKIFCSELVAKVNSVQLLIQGALEESLERVHVSRDVKEKVRVHCC